jgi:hypothetical protein
LPPLTLNLRLLPFPSATPLPPSTVAASFTSALAPHEHLRCRRRAEKRRRRIPSTVGRPVATRRRGEGDGPARCPSRRRGK